MAVDFAQWRRQFPILAHKTYLNSGSYGALSEQVRGGIERYMSDRMTRGADWDLWVTKNEAMRAAMAGLLGLQPDCLAITGSASAGINALASALDYSGPRRKILVTDFDFPTSAQIWHAQAQRGAEIIHVKPGPDGLMGAEQFAPLIDETVLLVAAPHVCYRNGVKIDLAEVTRLAHRAGAWVMADLFQTVGTEPIDLAALDVDFAVGGMSKYLLGTAGIGYLAVRESLVERLIPACSGWFAQADIGAMDISANIPHPSARRFEAGTPPVMNLYAAEAGLSIISEIGLPAIGARVRDLTGKFLAAMAGIGWPAVTPPGVHGPMIAVKTRDCAGLTDALAERGIIVSHRDGNIRAGFHFYNNDSDIETIVSALSELMKIFY
jgi:selenocysteine lyase/cysteine desulfurase